MAALLAGLRERYAGRTYRAEDFAAVGEAVGASAASVLGNWLSSTAAPGFLASPASVVRLRDDDSGEPSFIGQLGRYEMWLRTAADDRPIEFDGSAAAQGWNKLGVFDLEGGRVSVVVSNRTTGDIVIADAVGWLPLSAANSP